MHPDLFGESGAEFSDCDKYRYRLWRKWGDGKSVAFLMLNPSTADATKNDPTVERCHRRAFDMGFEALEVINLFAFRATDPADLKRAKSPIGPANDEVLLETCRRSDMTICAWGAHGTYQNRDKQVRDLLRENGIEAHVLAMTKFDQPRHPLYLSYKEQPVPWTNI